MWHRRWCKGGGRELDRWVWGCALCSHALPGIQGTETFLHILVSGCTCSERGPELGRVKETLYVQRLCHGRKVGLRLWMSVVRTSMSPQKVWWDKSYLSGHQPRSWAAQTCCSRDLQNLGPHWLKGIQRPAALVSPGISLEMQNLELTTRSSGPESVL